MDHLIGQRFNLISKSGIRYLGTLHEINPEQSTIALEDVYSFGTEEREAPKFIAASGQKFDYIVFRGSDVKDIKIAEEQEEERHPSPPNFPNDPAILNASRPGPPSQGPPQHHRGESPFPPPGYPPQPQFGGYYPPQQFGRGFGPPPGSFGPGPGFPNYGPPPPGYFPPPGQGFPPGPGHFQSHAPIGPPGQRPNVPQDQQQDEQPRAPGPPQDVQPTPELPVDNKLPPKPANTGVGSMPSAKHAATVVETKAAAPEVTKPGQVPNIATKTATTKPTPAPQKGNRVTPAVPLTVNQKSFTPPVIPASEGQQTTTNGTPAKAVSNTARPQVSMDEAARQAKEAVAAAMAKLNPTAATQAKPVPSAASIDALSKKVSEMGPSTNGMQRGRGGFRGGRGGYQRNGSGGHQAKKIEIPKSDFDFESANAKFNKEDLIKEAIASGSPILETPSEGQFETSVESESNTNGPKRKDSLPTGGAQAYNRSTSFFDNISSEARDREENSEARSNARQVRGEEFKKNIETFGQGNVDGGFRGRGRGGYGRGRQYGGNYRGFNRGYGGGFRGRGRVGHAHGQPHAQTQDSAPAES